jgi:indole-3-glycerol phosphate synthase
LPALDREAGAMFRAARAMPDPPDLRSALSGPHVAVIAEVKRRSPSEGTISEMLDPVVHARAYAEHGASAISVLTEEAHFGGTRSDLQQVSRNAGVPVLRKDFILHEAQVAEARAWGASGVLLIVRALGPSRLAALLASARELGLTALVEAHDAAEVDDALEAGADVIGINSRDLTTFRIDPAAWSLLRRIPAGRIAVAESGMSGRRDVERAAEAGADAVLVGSALSRTASPGPLVRELSGVVRRGR